MEYFIQVEGQDIEDQKAQNRMSSVRIGKVHHILTLKHPSEILPFKGNFPLVPEIKYEFFLNQTKKSHYYEELSDEVKKITQKAEKIVFFHNSFKKFLQEEEYGIKGFKLLTSEAQQQLFYKWLFKNKLDVGILHI